MAKTNLTNNLPVEDYGDIYVDPLIIIETSIDEDIQPCNMRTNNIDEDDDYDWIEVKERDYKAETPSSISWLNVNEKVAIIAALIVVVIVSTVVITRAIIEPRCKGGWIEIANKSCYKFLPTTCEEGCSFERAKEVCRVKGGKLAEPRDINSMKELIEIARDSKTLSARNFWIGLEFNTKERQFQWLSDDKEASLPDMLWNMGHPSYDGSHVHLMMGEMLLNDVGEGEVYKPVCQRKKEGDCAHGRKAFRILLQLHGKGMS